MTKDKVVLLLLPYWSPFVPPLGIACLKGFLQHHGFISKAFDANIEPQFSGVYQAYLGQLKSSISEGKWSNFYNIANDVLRDHMMAYINKKGDRDYIELIRLVIKRNYYSDVNHSQIHSLNNIVVDFYKKLEDYLVATIGSERPDVLGISVLNGTLPASLFALKLVKDTFPEVRTVMGGGGFTGELAVGSPNFAGLLDHTPYVDKVIIGEGENLFLKYLLGELPQDQRVYELNAFDDQTLNIDDMVMPDCSDFDLSQYPALSMYGSRGCPFQCSFCSETNCWGKYRRRPATQTVRELGQMSTKYGRKMFMMADSLLNPVLTPVSSALINTGVHVYIDGYLRADEEVCNDESVALWKKAGFYRARIGVESGSQRVLDLMNKKVTVEQIAKSISTLARAGIKTTTYWVAGHPGETEEDFRLTLDLIEQLKDDIYEADCNAFTYYVSGQSHSGDWSERYRRHPLYPEDTDNMLVVQTWLLEAEPLRHDAYERLNRFTAHCKELDIPNPYTLYEIHQADKRWQSLHANAVPPLTKMMGC
jgi:radical SAM superfamily enzyme YgiQ (UPF0313 family)